LKKKGGGVKYNGFPVRRVRCSFRLNPRVKKELKCRRACSTLKRRNERECRTPTHAESAGRKEKESAETTIWTRWVRLNARKGQREKFTGERKKGTRNCRKDLSFLRVLINQEGEV